MTKSRFVFRRLRSTCMIVSGFFLLFAFALLTAWAIPQAARVVVDPMVVDLAPIESMTIALRVENVTNLYGLELKILYDPTIVNVDSIRPGDFLSADFLVVQNVDNDSGRASLAYTQIGNPARSGSGTIAVLVLRKTDCSGQSPLQLADVILSDQNGNAIPFTQASGTIENGAALANRKLAGAVFHDADEDGNKGTNEEALASWPIYIQRFSVERIGTHRLTLSDHNGDFRIEDLSCGRYQVWSKNGSSLVLTQTLRISASADVQLPALPVTGTLIYPLKQVFLPAVVLQ